MSIKTLLKLGLKVNKEYSDVKFLPVYFRSLVQWNERQKQKYITSGYHSISFKNYVGVIQVKGLIIEILPKADKIATSDKSLWKEALLYMLSVFNNLNIYHSTPAFLKTRNVSLMDFFIRIFIEETFDILHKGLVKKYRHIEKNNTFIKGKIFFKENIKQNLLNKEKCFVRMSTYDYQNIYNGILKTAINILRATFLGNKSTNEQLQNLDIHFEEIKPVAPRTIDWDRITYNRKNSHYKKAVNISRLIIENCNPDIQAGKNDILAFLFDMNKLFETFIAKQCVKASKEETELLVVSQNSKSFWKRQTIRPDLFFKCNNHNIIADTKWKLIQTKPSSDDLKQMYVYNIYWQSCISFLIYPSQSSSEENKIINNFASTELLHNFEHGIVILPINLFKENQINTEIGKDIINVIKTHRK